MRRYTSKFSQDHYIVLFDIKCRSNETEEKFNQRKKRFDLWIKELNRIGIREMVVGSAEELEEVLQSISLKSRGKSIFVSGSHEKEDMEVYLEYGKKLADFEDVVLINGQNQGIGIKVVNGFMETAVNSRKELTKIIKFFPNPYSANPSFSNDSELLTLLKAERAPLFVSTKLFVVFAGGMGTEAEVEVAKEKGCLILIAITDKKDFENSLIKRLLKEEYCLSCMNKVPDYYKKVRSCTVPDLSDLVQATKVLLDA